MHESRNSMTQSAEQIIRDIEDMKVKGAYLITRASLEALQLLAQELAERDGRRRAPSASRSCHRAAFISEKRFARIATDFCAGWRNPRLSSIGGSTLSALPG